MMRLLNYYTSSYNGFRREVWILTLVSLVNRAGTMVIPFLSLYLTGHVGLSLEQVGWVMSAFGLGSLVGSWAGGKLSDLMGAYATMLWSLILSGFMFIALQLVQSFAGFCIGIFLVMSVADMFRPAMFVLLRAYSKPENRTRSVTLVRLAINLGFSVGPALGGMLIAGLGYDALFWIDGITCMLAGAVILIFLPKKIVKPVGEDDEMAVQLSRNPYRDFPYLIFLFAVFVTGFVFLQCFSSIPLYYRDVHHLEEQPIGLLLALNGLLIFLIEMPLIKYTENKQWSLWRILIISALLIGLSYVVLNLWHSMTVLVISIVFLTFGEMLNFPIANRIAMDRAEGSKIGAYMGLYTIAFSLAHITGHNGGLMLIAHFGYTFTWWIMGIAMLFATVVIIYARNKFDLEIKNAAHDPAPVKI